MKPSAAKVWAARLGCAWLALPILCAVGCKQQRTPERVCASFLRAVGEGDPSAVFDNLLETTQWAFYTVQKSHRRMRDLIESTYPAQERAGALGRLYAADADSGRDLFARIYPDRYAPNWTARLGPVSPPLVHPAGTGRQGELLCQRQGGQPFRIGRSPKGRWGIAEIDSEWEQAQLRVVHDLDTIAKNAEIYRRVQSAAQGPR